jgi:hypothetical protein
MRPAPWISGSLVARKSEAAIIAAPHINSRQIPLSIALILIEAPAECDCVPIARIFPGALNLEARMGKERVNSVIGKSVTVLRMDGFTISEVKLELSTRDLNILVTHAFEVHLDTGCDRIPTGTVPKSGRIKIRTELIVEPIQNVQIERRGHSLIVVISSDQGRLLFHVVSAAHLFSPVLD